MYVRPGTTLVEIQNEIERINQELKYERLTAYDRQSLYEELDYLESFIPQETW